MKLNKKSLIAAVLLMALTSASSVYADDNPINKGFYIGGEIGVAGYDRFGNVPDSTTYSIEKDPRVSGRITAGYQFNQYLSEELGFDIYHTATRVMDLGKAVFIATPGQVYRSTFSQFYAFDLMTKVSMPITKRVNVFVKGGPALVHVYYSKPTSTMPPTVSLWQWNWPAGANNFFTGKLSAGVSYQISNKTALTLTAAHVFGIGNDYSNRNYLPEIDSATFGFVYHI